MEKLKNIGWWIAFIACVTILVLAASCSAVYLLLVHVTLLIDLAMRPSLGIGILLSALLILEALVLKPLTENLLEYIREKHELVGARLWLLQKTGRISPELKRDLIVLQITLKTLSCPKRRAALGNNTRKLLNEFQRRRKNETDSKDTDQWLRRNTQTLASADPEIGHQAFVAAFEVEHARRSS